MSITMRNVTASGNGRSGIRIEAESGTEINLDNITTNDNGAIGLNITQRTTLQEYLGLSSTVDIEDIKKVIEEVRQKRHTVQPETIISASGLYQRITDATLNFSTFASNIVSIASNPSIQGMFTNT